jgi:hypothetical protein
VKTFTAPIASIRRDGGTQIRAALDEATVAAYAQLLAEGGELPPVVVFDDEKTLWLADGFHRVESELRAGRKRISYFRHIGTQRDALLYAVGANATHGLPRSNADKRRAIEAMLADTEWATWTDRRIAAATHVGHELVARVREESIGGNANGPTRKAADGRQFPASRAKDSTPGQPTAAPPAPAANPVDEGEKGAGVTGAAQAAAMHPAPAPDEPRDRLVNVERLLRDAQAEIAPLLARGEAMSVQAALDAALWVVRKALGDGVAATQERLADRPMSWTADQQERHAKVGRYSPPEKRLHVELPDGHEYEPIDDTEAF